MNVSDSERIASFLEAQNFQPAKKITQADLVIFNTCGIRKMAEDRAYGQIHNVWKNNKKAKIILTGCLANRKDIQEKLKNKVDLFCEIKDFPFVIASVVKQSSNIKIGLAKNEIASSTTLPRNDNYLCIPPKYSNSFQAYVPIMTGCNNFCSYCVVPYARGRETSRPVEEILTEIKGLIKNGVKEITLLGQNVNSYKGKDQKSKETSFSQLLKMTDAIPGDFWIRFMSPHPKDMTDNLIETITSLEKVCEAVHLPLQAGDDTVLARMNRAYSRTHYLGLVEKIKKGFEKNKPGAIFSLSSDIIVGFPGETKAQLEKTASVMRKSKFDMVYFGQFSRRPGTVAWEMKDNITKAEKVEREKYLNEILAKTALANNKKYLKKTFPVLVTNEKKGNYFGTTRTLKNVKIKTNEKNLLGKFVDVKIINVTAWHLEGEIYAKQ